MKITYDFTIEDWLAFQKYHLFESGEYNKMEALGKYLFIMIVFAHLLYEIYTKAELAYIIFLLVFYSAFSFIWIMFFPKYYKKNVTKRLRKKLEKGNNSAILGKTELEIENQNLILRTPAIKQEMKIKNIEKVINTQDYIFVFNTSFSAIVIPKKCIKHNQIEMILSQLKLNND